MAQSIGNGARKVCVVGGARTPFARAGTAFNRHSFQQLGVHAVKAAVQRLQLDPERIDKLAFGTVLLDPRTPNWAREILFAAGLPKHIYAEAVSNNCISGLVAVTSVAESIALGKCECGLAGGSESMSNPTLTLKSKANSFYLDLSRARSTGDRLKLLTNFRPNFLFPKAPSITEPSTGLTMGQHMEITAKELSIGRAIQDQIAYQSHARAAAATADGRLIEDIEPLDGVKSDLLIRKDTSLEKLAKLRPVFDSSAAGTLTAGNSSALTDGAACVVLMSEERAQAEKREVLGYIRDYEYSAIDSNKGLLMAPSVAVPKLLTRLGMKLEDFDLIEIHEAFGAQVAANVKAWEEGLFGPAVGKIDYEKVNVMGGSIAIGHPFAATGGRILLGICRELRRRKAKRGLISVCAAGGMACAMVVEVSGG